MIKYAKADILEVRHSAARVVEHESGWFNKLALASPKITDDGFLYVKVRAISSRVNKNNDGWPSEELAKAYKSFEGRPIFVDHNNDNPNRTRGVIVSSVLHVDDEKTSALDPYYASAPDNHKPPTWIELLLEVDANSFPRLASAVISGEIDAVSMGANIDESSCSVCDNKAKNPSEYCDHVNNKGIEFEIVSSDGSSARKLAYEDCYGINFFEISFVFDPADTTALIHDVGNSTSKVASGGLYDQGGDGEDASKTPEIQDEGEYQADQAKPSEEESVIAWRLEQLEKIGFPPGVAAQIAPMTQVDWHQLEKWLSQGATPEQALEIVSKMIEDSKREKAGTTAGTLASLDHDDELEGKTADIGGGEYKLNDQSEREINYTPQSELQTAPEEVDTLRADVKCPQCDSEMETDKTVGLHVCPECNFQQPPAGFDDPDLGMHKRIEDDLHPEPSTQGLDKLTPDAQDTLPVTDPTLEQAQPGLDPNAQSQSPIGPVRPVNAISRNESEAVMSDMKFTVTHRFVESASSDNKVILNDEKKGTDEPTETQIVSDQLTSVESNNRALIEAVAKAIAEGQFDHVINKEADMQKETDREVIKRVEEDGSGVKRTEEIVKEYGPMGEKTEEVPAEDSAEGETTEDSASSDDSASGFGGEDTSSTPESDSSTTEDEDKGKWSSEQRLFAALKLAKLASEIGLIASKDELTFVGEIEDETMEQITARMDTLSRVKEAGMAKKPRALTARRASYPSLPKVAASSQTDDDVPFEALFL